MTGKFENIVRYTAEEVEAMRRRGEGRTDWPMSQEEAMRRRRADPEAPRAYEGSDDTVGLPQPKEQVTLGLDRDVLRWVRAKGRGYQPRINAVLRSYYLHEQGKDS
jgi:uncharacterized protein (DUF4415 family)